ncbi:hypothetical protein RI367_002322 [Sorochytrium milnesiophthora]
MQKSRSLRTLNLLSGSGRDAPAIDVKALTLAQDTTTQTSKIIRTSLLDSPPVDAPTNTAELDSLLHSSSTTAAAAPSSSSSSPPPPLSQPSSDALSDFRESRSHHGSAQSLHLESGSHSASASHPDLLRKSGSLHNLGGHPLQTISNALKGIKLRRMPGAGEATTASSTSSSVHTLQEDGDHVMEDSLAPEAQPAPPPPQQQQQQPSVRIITTEMLLQELAGPGANSFVFIDTRPLEPYQASHLIGSFNVDVPTLLQKRWARKNSMAVGAPAAAPVKVVNIETLVQGEQEKQRYRSLVDAGARKYVLYDEQMSVLSCMPGSVIATISGDLLANGKEVLHLAGGYDSFAVYRDAAGYLSAPLPVTARLSDGPNLAASANGEFTGFSRTFSSASSASSSSSPLDGQTGKHRTSFSLRTNNLRGSMSRNKALQAAGAAGGSIPAAGTPTAAPLGPGAGLRKGSLKLNTLPIPQSRSPTLAAECEVDAPMSALPQNQLQSQSGMLRPSTLEAIPSTPVSETLLSPASMSEPSTPQGLGPSMIYDWLYLGPDLYSVTSGTSSEHGHNELQSLGVSAILNMAMEVVPDDFILSHYQYKKFECRDTPDEKIERMLGDAIGFIDQVRRANGRVYVHCKAGKSRSATIVLAYLIQHEHMSVEQAVAFLKERRPAVSPNIGFFSVLKEFEERCRRPSP